MDNSKSRNFLFGAVVIAAAHLIVKLMGALFRIPLANMIGPQGMAVYQSAYSIYLVLFVISTAGLPVAISKMISQNIALGKDREVRKIYITARNLMLIMGIVCSAVLIAGSSFFSASLGIPEGYPAIIALAPSLFFVCISSVYRGYYQGRQNMIPTAVSEIFESVFKLIIGLSAAGALVSAGNVAAASGGIFGVTAGTFFSALFLIIYYKKNKKTKKNDIFILNSERNTILKELITMAVPITLGSCVFSLTTFIDTAMVLRQLKSIGYTAEEAKTMFGYYSGYALTLFNLPASVVVGLGMSLVPAISTAVSVGNRDIAGKNIASGIRFTWQLTFPAGIGLAVLAKQILHLLYPGTDFILPMNAIVPNNKFAAFFANNTDATRLLSFLGLATSLVCVTMVSNSVLQALGKSWLSVRNMIFGGLVKIISNYILISIPQINVMGAPVSTTFCYLTITLINIISIGRNINVRYGFSSMVIKPSVSAAAMSAAALAVYNYLISGHSNLIACTLSICAAVLVYIAVMLIVKGFKREDIALLPKSGVIIKYLGRCFS